MELPAVAIRRPGVSADQEVIAWEHSNRLGGSMLRVRGKVVLISGLLSPLAALPWYVLVRQFENTKSMLVEQN